MNKLLISAHTILPIASEAIINHSIAIDGGLIIDIGKEAKLKRKYPRFKHLNLGKGILLPGFINGHVHLELGWTKSKIGNFNNFTEWLSQIILSKSKEISKLQIAKSIEIGIHSSILSGVTTIGEISSYNDYDFKFLKKSGLRIIVFRELFDRNLENFEDLNFNKSSLFEIRPFPHAPYSNSPELLEKVFSFCKKKNIPAGIHLAESKDESKFIQQKSNNFEKIIFPLIGKENFARKKANSPFDYLTKFKNLENIKLSAVHMVQVKKEELKKIKKLNIGIILCPRSNQYLKVGLPPLKHFSEYDNVGLGTDGLSSNYNLNFFEEIRALHLLYTKYLGAGASYKTVYTATLGGAKALFFRR